MYGLIRLINEFGGVGHIQCFLRFVIMEKSTITKTELPFFTCDIWNMVSRGKWGLMKQEPFLIFGKLVWKIQKHKMILYI
jgi:hypothetical protein